MDLSSLESSIKTLERALDSWTVWLVLATFLVVVGLILEYWHEVRDLLKERPVRWKQGQKILGAVLVTVGVAGELCVQYKASKVETKLRSVNHEVEALLNKKAADAQMTAGAAALQAAEANLHAEAERLKRVELEAVVSPRRLSLKQQQAIANSCRRFAGRRVIITSYAGDAEAMVLGEQIRAALHSARIEVDLSTGGLLTAGSLLTGVQVSGPNEDLRLAIESSLRNDGHLKMASPEEKRVPEGSASVEAGALTHGPSEASVFVGVKPPVLLTLP